MRIPGADEALSHLAAWSSRGKWREKLDGVVAEHLREACSEFHLKQENLRNALGGHHYEVVMACALEDFFARRFGGAGLNVIDDYLDHRSWRESRGGRDYLRALRDSVMSLYEVVDLEPGSHLVLKDLVRGGEPVTVDERLGSLTAVRWDQLGTRVLAVDDRKLLSGTVLHFPEEAGESLLRALREGARSMEPQLEHPDAASAKGSSLVSLLTTAARVFTRIYLTHTLSALRRPAPRLANFDGDEIVFTTVRFPVARESISEVERRLSVVPVLECDASDPHQWVWKAQAGIETPHAQASQAPSVTFGSFDERGGRITGHVELQAAELVLRVNSVKRAERGRALLAELLGALIGEPQSSTQSIESALEQHGAGEHPPASTGLGIPLEERVRILHSYLEQHYRRCLDQPIPALDGASPRDAAQSAEGREKVVAWLKYLENSEERARGAGEPAYDFTWMWQELGILDLQR